MDVIGTIDSEDEINVQDETDSEEDIKVFVRRHECMFCCFMIFLSSMNFRKTRICKVYSMAGYSLKNLCLMKKLKMVYLSGV